MGGKSLEGPITGGGGHVTIDHPSQATFFNVTIWHFLSDPNFNLR